MRVKMPFSSRGVARVENRGKIIFSGRSLKRGRLKGTLSILKGEQNKEKEIKSDIFKHPGPFLSILRPFLVIKRPF